MQLPTEHEMAQAIMKSIPGCKTEALFNAYSASFDAFRFLVNAIFEENAANIKQGRETLEKALDVAQKVTSLGNRLRENPEAGGAHGAQFIDPPSQFTEYDRQKRLLLELGQISSVEALSVWYRSNREEIDKVVSPSLRNFLLDSIREAKRKLELGSSSTV